MKKKILGLSIIFFLVLASPLCAVAADILRIHFIDVGEGDSILIEAPNGKTALVDTGNPISGYKVVEYLKKNNIDNLDYLILTHPHYDHIGGVFFVAQMLKANYVCDNGQDLLNTGAESGLHHFYAKLIRSRKDYRALKRGDVINLDGVTIRALWPYEAKKTNELNYNSLVLMVEYNGFRCLLAADITAAAEEELRQRDINLKADILKVAHHGSSDSNSQDLLKAASPKICIISIDKDNINGYPSSEVIERLNAITPKTFFTYKNGTIIVSVSDDGKIITATES
jgi:beta-lactamase superfamily II metal-dependent hydrolase